MRIQFSWAMLVFAIAVLPSCKMKEKSNLSKNTLHDSLFISINKTPCFGACATYSMNIYSNGGTSTLSGKKFTKNLGTFEYVFDSTTIDFLRQTVKDKLFFELENVYDDPKVTDLPTVTIDVYMNGKRKKVTGRVETPLHFNQLSACLDSIASLQVWNRVTGKLGDD